ncbi:NUDIX domain-containing protein [Trichophyton tonsurans CBS 112818]|uniref:NUDIX domain-containing protein n=1 Tax=Trichophyton tonsurans (strain CBS 112818) TaxID=647933 RepID=F2S722_TRIT1|nr:NUDIX domain-containing protein [Trichophyton tonsurans CBS 112818]
MAPLSQESKNAIERLRKYTPPPTNYYSMPSTRQASVLLLLFADRRGDLRVILTIRASTLKSYPGQAALPGGKADGPSETPFQTARREAYEEIGLPNIDQQMPSPFWVEHLCELPASLARTELAVRPCIALLHSYNEKTGEDADPEEAFIPQLDAKEVAAVFTAPFHNFLKVTDEPRGEGDDTLPGKPSDWYEGSWTQWNSTQWRMHHFFVAITNQRVATPKQHSKEQDDAINQLEEEKSSLGLERFRVFGMTARILVDAARVAYDEEPEFEHNSHLGDEDMISRLRSLGRFSEVVDRQDTLTPEVFEKAAKLT